MDGVARVVFSVFFVGLVEVAPTRRRVDLIFFFVKRCF